jgi:hypothetical protein
MLQRYNGGEKITVFPILITWRTAESDTDYAGCRADAEIAANE